MTRLKKHFSNLLLAFFAASACLFAQFTKYHPDGNLFLPAGQVPAQPGWMTESLGARNPHLVNDAEYAEWLHGVREWRNERLIRIGYNDREYRRLELLWTQRDFIAPQMMAEDRFFYDVKNSKYTVDRYLDDVDSRYGGIDSVLIWPVYPNIGIDNRNQFDMLRDLPGGIPALQQMIREFHKRNVRVFFPMMPWDTGTRDETLPLWDAVAKLMAEVGADGVNGDTFNGIPRAYREASDKTGHSIAFQPEVDMDTDEFLMWDQQSWGYWKYPFEPLVSKLKILEPRHMVNVCDRWALNRTNNLQAAFFNGVGYVSWENVWGIWNGITPRDGETLRRISAIYRQFAKLFVSQDWRPGVPTLQFGVFASEFPGERQSLWTVINRNKYEVSGRILGVNQVAGVAYYDLMSGQELKPVSEGNKDFLNLTLEPNGYAAILRTSGSSPDFDSFLLHMKQLTAKPLTSYSDVWQCLPQKLVAIERTKSYRTAPQGMVAIPAARYDFLVSGIEIEGGNDNGVDVEYPWENSPRRQHHSTVDVSAFYLDKYPVTNSQFAAFVKESGYKPADDHNFLKDWKRGRYPDGWANKPVTWVSLEDARAYSAWAGKRLPREWEWQYAAQGIDGRRYPWGNEERIDAVPTPQSGRLLKGPSDVTAHPAGASPFGVMDMIGNVFEWTDEYVDDHTRADILRGDGYYHPQGAQWYFPHPERLTEHAKYLLMAPAKDRSATIGFRCAADY